MPDLYLTCLNRPDVEAAALADEEILAAIEGGLAMQGRGEAVIEPRVHLEPRPGTEGHFNVLRGFLGGQVGMAGVNVVGDLVGNYTRGLPSELGLKVSRKPSCSGTVACPCPTSRSAMHCWPRPPRSAPGNDCDTPDQLNGGRSRPAAPAGPATAWRPVGADLVVAVAPMLREVRAMGLTWRDLVSSVAALAMVLAYWLFVFQYVPLLASAWATSAVELILGSVCAVAAAADLHIRPQPQAGRIARRITTVLGVIALLAGLAGLAANSGKAVEILLVATVFLWLTGTVWHVLSIGGEP